MNMPELTGRNVNEELHTTSIRQPHPGPIHVKGTVQTLDKKTLIYQPISQSTPASVSTISPKSSSYLDTDQGKALDEMLRKVADFQSNSIDGNCR